MFYWDSFFENKDEVKETLIIFLVIVLIFSILATITYFTIGLEATIPSCTYPNGYPIIFLEIIVSVAIGFLIGNRIIEKIT